MAKMCIIWISPAPRCQRSKTTGSLLFGDNILDWIGGEWSSLSHKSEFLYSATFTLSVPLQKNTALDPLVIPSSPRWKRWTSLPPCSTFPHACLPGSATHSIWLVVWTPQNITLWYTNIAMGKSPLSMGKSTLNHHFSIAMFVYQMVIASDHRSR